MFCLRAKPLSIGAALISIFCIVVASNINLYTEHRPQHVNINYYQNLDTGKSYVHLSSQEPLLEPLRSFVDVDTTQQLIPYLSRGFSQIGQKVKLVIRKHQFIKLNIWLMVWLS